MTKSIRDQMDSMFRIKRVNGEYLSKIEYNNHRKKRYVEISDEWIGKQESFEDRQIRLNKIDSFELGEALTNIDKKFCTDTEEFVNKYGNCVNIKKFHEDETVIYNDRLMVYNIGRDIVRNFILERSNLLIRSNCLYIPNCKNENDVSGWFEENCNNLCLGISTHRNRHSKFLMKGSRYSGVDHICRFIGEALESHKFYRCKDNDYRPLLNRYMSEKQIMTYNRFYEFVEADSVLIELEYLSSNFVKHKHPSIIDMVICYKKDKDLSVPVLELGLGRDING